MSNVELARLRDPRVLHIEPARRLPLLPSIDLARSTDCRPTVPITALETISEEPSRRVADPIVIEITEVVISEAKVETITDSVAVGVGEIVSGTKVETITDAVSIEVCEVVPRADIRVVTDTVQVAIAGEVATPADIEVVAESIGIGVAESLIAIAERLTRFGEDRQSGIAEQIPAQ